jgi:hypothetical protein
VGVDPSGEPLLYPIRRDGVVYWGDPSPHVVRLASDADGLCPLCRRVPVASGDTCSNCQTAIPPGGASLRRWHRRVDRLEKEEATPRQERAALKERRGVMREWRWKRGFLQEALPELFRP